MDIRPHMARRRSVQCGWLPLAAVTGWLVALLLVVGLYRPDSSSSLVPKGTQDMMPSYTTAPILVSYSYFEKDDIQRANFEFFLAAGTHYPALHQSMHWVFVISGETCTPCKKLFSMLQPVEGTDLSDMGIRAAFTSTKFSMLMRTENIGMDVAAHNITLEFMSWRQQLAHYKYFILLNSSIKGPFSPSYMPANWHWTHAYMARFTADIHAVSSSLVCLPEADAGGPGPRLESWAFAVDEIGLQVALDAGVFHVRNCKLCTDGQGIVVGGEYGITRGMFKAGYNVATLMSKYAVDTDWRNPQNWHCNNNVHPSRHGTYDGISFHPYETVFVKSSWHVADPYTSRYSTWHLNHLVGRAGTDGRWDQRLYRYGVSMLAQDDPHMIEAYRPKEAVVDAVFAEWQQHQGGMATTV